MTRENLIRNWGPEVILRCSCKDIPSHSMNGRLAKCPVCNETVQMLTGTDWETIQANNPR